MEEPKSARDMMIKSVADQPRPVDLYMKREYSRRQYKGETRFMFCPKCYAQIKRAGLDFKKELKPLWVYTFKCLYQVDKTSGFVAYEKFYKCDRCMKGDALMSEDELIKAWIDKAAAKKASDKLIDLTDRHALENF